MPARRSRVGAHIAVGRGGGFARVDAIGAEVAQVFSGNPRGWAAPAVDPAADERFRMHAADGGLAVFVHAPYLINLGSPDGPTLARSADALARTLRRADALGAKGVVVHAGSAVAAGRRADALQQVRRTVLPLLDDAPPVPLLIEPTAGGGAALASDAASLAEYLDALGRDPRLGVCLDTCHVHAAGHDLSADAPAVLRSFVRAAGPNRIGLVHANDSRDPAGSRRDRHAALGRGTIGLEPFRALFTTRGLRGVPIVVETEDADHAADVAALKRLRDG